jgi:plastocyanin
MTCRLHIFFDYCAGGCLAIGGLAIGCLSGAVPALAATLSGQVQLVDSRAPEVIREKNFSGVVVWLEPVQAKAPPAAARTHTILQKGKRFQPHISVIPVGSVIDLPNRDLIFHNAFSNFAGQPFDTGLYAPGTTTKIRFVRDGVVRVFCNIHATMSAVVVVVPTPWFTSSGNDGSFKIDEVPPGDYTMKVWHERATSDTLRSLEKRITVAEGGSQAPALAISELRWTPAPQHKNKYGGDYGPEPPDRVPYRGVRR